MSDVSLPFVMGAPERAQRDGCGCPYYIKRCVHYGDTVLVLVDRFALAEPCAGQHLITNDSRRFRVASATLPLVVDCPTCGAWKPTEWQGDFYTEESANDAFDSAADDLRGTS